MRLGFATDTDDAQGRGDAEEDEHDDAPGDGEQRAEGDDKKQDEHGGQRSHDRSPAASSIGPR